MNKAIFLDRDGVINKEIGYVYRIEDFILTDDIIPSLKKLQAAPARALISERISHPDSARIKRGCCSILREEWNCRAQEIFRREEKFRLHPNNLI